MPINCGRGVRHTLSGARFGGQMTEEARLKNLEDAVVKMIADVKALRDALNGHQGSPDAHNPGVLGRKVKKT